MASKVVNISLPEELLEEVDQMAQREKRSRSELFREAVRRYIEEKMKLALAWERVDRQSFAALADSALRRIWDNEIDAVYDDWKPKPHGRKA